MLNEDEFPAHMRELLPAVMAQFQEKEKMSNDTFAHALWGIDLDAYAARIESPELRRLNGLLREARAEQAEDQDIDDSEADAIVAQILRLVELRDDNTIGAHIVEDDADRGSDTDAGTLLLGYGMRCFPFNAAERYEHDRQINIRSLNGMGAGWHTWVT